MITEDTSKYRLQAVTRFVGSHDSLAVPTGSRTHPWLSAAIPSGFEREAKSRTPGRRFDPPATIG